LCVERAVKQVKAETWHFNAASIILFHIECAADDLPINLSFMLKVGVNLIRAFLFPPLIKPDQVQLSHLLFTDFTLLHQFKPLY